MGNLAAAEVCAARVVHVDDSAIVREAVKALFAAAGECIASCSTGALFLQTCRQLQPRVVLVDYDLGEAATGLELAQVAAAEAPCEIVVLTVDPTIVEPHASAAKFVLRKPFTAEGVRLVLGLIKGV